MVHRGSGNAEHFVGDGHVQHPFMIWRGRIKGPYNLPAGNFGFKHSMPVSESQRASGGAGGPAGGVVVRDCDAHPLANNGDEQRLRFREPMVGPTLVTPPGSKPRRDVFNCGKWVNIAPTVWL